MDLKPLRSDDGCGRLAGLKRIVKGLLPADHGDRPETACLLTLPGITDKSH